MAIQLSGADPIQPLCANSAQAKSSQLQLLGGLNLLASTLNEKAHQ